MSKVNIYGLKAYISKTFDLHVGKRIKYVERGGEEKEHIYEVKQLFPHYLHMPDLVEYQKALERAAKALKKQIPRKVNNLSKIFLDFGVGKKIKVGAYGNCPNCNYNIDTVSNYCTRCGQRLDWSEENDI